MRLFGVLLAVFLALITTANAWPQNPPSEASQDLIVPRAAGKDPLRKTCKRIRALTILTNVANNQTALDAMLAKGKFDQEQIEFIKSNMASVAAELATLKSNTTLTAACDVVNARRKVARQCRKIKRLEKLSLLAINQTAYDQHVTSEVFSQKQIDDFKKKVEKAKVKLQALKSNSTLVSLCRNDTGLQQDGVIGTQTAGNSGAIATVSNSAAAYLQHPHTVSSILVTVLFTAFAVF
ncbi:hypothetical protein BKA66DRAFT_570595 [Pyrenochaeta sp. MPI-SDFR-AT-0127]|nr:hypothetical protein BKA66DRAFT_570595 [Pyrenochaeta sp. MPI-SDFR-AT-0127]